MWKFIKYLFYSFLYYFRNKETRHFIQRIAHITGFMPQNVALYRLACLHVSQKQKSDVGKDHKSNERLEYLGDAVLNLVVAHYLFRKYPLEKEGFLTEIRSRLVNRNSLNNLALKIGLDSLVVFQQGLKNIPAQFQSINGNALEALVGAVYLDKGADICEQFILKNLLKNHINIKEIIDTPQNFKSLLVQWGQQQDKDVRFETKQLQNSAVGIMFVTDLYVNDKIMMSAQDRSKKKSEQLVAQKAYLKFIKGKNWENKPKDHKKSKEENTTNHQNTTTKTDNPQTNKPQNQKPKENTKQENIKQENKKEQIQPTQKPKENKQQENKQQEPKNQEIKNQEIKPNNKLPKRQNVVPKQPPPNNIVNDVKVFVKIQEEQNFDFPSFENESFENELPQNLEEIPLPQEKPKKKKRPFKKRKFTILKDQNTTTTTNNTNAESI